MSSNTDTPDPIAKCIRGLQEALRNNSAQGQPPPVERRKLRTLVSECGKKTRHACSTRTDRRALPGGWPLLRLSRFRFQPQARLMTSGSPQLARLPPDAMLFPREADLRKFGRVSSSAQGPSELEPLKGQSKGLGFGYPTGAAWICCARSGRTWCRRTCCHRVQAGSPARVLSSS